MNSELYNTCNEIFNLCNDNDEPTWSRVFSYFLNKIEDGSVDGELRREIKSIFAGMGSFNDLILQPNNKPLQKENNRLRILKTQLFEQVMYPW